MQSHSNAPMDDDLDKDWKPSGRPQSTMARNFSAALDDLFRMDGGLDSLSKNVFEKKQAVSSQSQELEAIEARLRAAEERLKNAGEVVPSRPSDQRRTPVQTSFGEAEQDITPQSSVAKSDTEEGSADESSRQQASLRTPTGTSIPGVTPETPRSQTSRDYVMVDKPRGT